MMLTCEQHVGHQRICSTSERAFQPVCNAINDVQVNGEEQRGEGHSYLTLKDGCGETVLSPSNNVYSSA